MIWKSYHKKVGSIFKSNLRNRLYSTRAVSYIDILCLNESLSNILLSMRPLLFTGLKSSPTTLYTLARCAS